MQMRATDTATTRARVKLQASLLFTDCDAIFREQQQQQRTKPKTKSKSKSSVCKRAQAQLDASSGQREEHVQRRTAKRIISNNLVLLHHVRSHRSLSGRGRGGERRDREGEEAAKLHKDVCQREGDGRGRQRQWLSQAVKQAEMDTERERERGGRGKRSCDCDSSMHFKENHYYRCGKGGTSNADV